MSSLSQRYLVTGGAGFVGSCLVRRLLELDQEVHVLVKADTSLWRLQDLLSHSKLVIHKLDLLNKVQLTKTVHHIKPTVIYHLAARGAYSTQNQAEDIFQSDIFGTLYLLEACQDIEYTLFVNTGSSSEYGFKFQPMNEDDRLEPNSYYAIAKATATHLAVYLAASTHKPIVTLRLFSVFGPYEAPTRFFPTLLAALHHQRPLTLVDPTTARDFVYVDDVVDLFLAVEKLKLQSGQVFNVGTGRQSTIQEVVELAKSVTKKNNGVQVG